MFYHLFIRPSLVQVIARGVTCGVKFDVRVLGLYLMLKTARSFFISFYSIPVCDRRTDERTGGRTDVLAAHSHRAHDSRRVTKIITRCGKSRSYGTCISDWQ